MINDLTPPLDRKRRLSPRERRSVYSHRLKVPAYLNGQGRIAEHLLKGIFYEANLLVHIWQADIQGIYLDVGANIGNHLAFFAHKTHASHIFAFEPVAEHVGTCLDIARLNGYQHKVSVVPFAVSDRPGMLKYTYQLLSHYPKRAAAAVKLDDVVPPGVGLIKMDIEGGEPAALRGAKRILSEDRPALYIEAHDDEALEVLMKELRAFDYELTGAVFNASPTYEIVPSEKVEFFKSIQSEGSK
ncbi:FkbM family methyltransferase [Bosea sp. AK1]|nr:FkbM family methyltransferase [Bosea sp. AK1]